MDEFLSIILLIVVYAIAFSAKGKEKKKKRAASATKHSRPLPEEAFAGQSARTVAAKRKKELHNSQSALQQRRAGAVKDAQAEQLAKAAEAVQAAPALRVEQTMLPDIAPEKRGMRLVSIDQERMQAAGEGEDPCHVGAASSRGREPLQQDEERAPWRLSAEDVWRGVIMSEVLMRPQERAALRRIKRRMP